MTNLPQLKSLSHSIGLHGVGSTLSKHEQLTKYSQKLVSQAFYGNLLKQIHNSPFKSKMFDGGRGGEAFTSLLDQHLADRMAGNKTATGLVGSIVKNIEYPRGTMRPQSALKTAVRHSIAASTYLKAPPKNRSEHVPANLRA